MCGVPIWTYSETCCEESCRVQACLNDLPMSALWSPVQIQKCSPCSYFPETQDVGNQTLLNIAPLTEIKLECWIILTLLCLEINDLISLKLLKSSNTDGTTCWQCTDCHYKSSHKATIKRHVESKHLEAVYQCDMCQHQVSTKHQLNAHRSLKHGTKYIPY